MQQKKTFTLKSGIQIPAIGFGPGILGYTGKMANKQSGIISITKRAYNKFISRPKQRTYFVDAIVNAFDNGFRLFDYSHTYGNHDLIALALKKSHVGRNELMLTSRVSNQAQFDGKVREEFMETLSEWGVDYIDILQFHWPVTGRFIETWKEMIRLKEDGFVKVLGVANCHQHHIDALGNASGVIPEINQIEVHPLFTQKPLIEYCQSKGIIVEAYTPVARYDDRLVRLPLLRNLEQKYNKSFIQIILRWHIQNGVIPVVKAMNPSHQKLNLNIFDFEISAEDMKLIDGINIESRLRYNPDNCDFTIL